MGRDIGKCLELLQHRKMGGIAVSKYSMTQLLLMVKEEAQNQNIERITSAQNIFTLLHEYATKKKEYFIAVTLDGASKMINKRVIHIGTLNQSLVHPREVFRPAILDNAAGIIIAHNHPSGTLEASRADIQIPKDSKR